MCKIAKETKYDGEQKHTANTELLFSEQYFSPSLFCQHSQALRIQQREYTKREARQDSAETNTRKTERP